MNFCETCENMLYMKVDGTNLINYCKNCDFSIKNDYSKNSKVILNNNFETDRASYEQYISPYIKFDNTLPREHSINCPNKATQHKDKKDEVIVIKYDQGNMKYLYYCVNCENFWTTDNHTPFKA